VNIVFLGTPAFAVPSLRTLSASRHRVVLAVTRPDRPRGRGLASKPTAVRVEAERLGIPVQEPATVKDPAVGESLRGRADLFVVASYGEILTDAFLAIPPKGCLNLHPSLLPRWRGPSPIPSAILEGDAVTGATVFQIERRTDAGPIFSRREVLIGPDEAAPSLFERLALVGAALLVETVDAIEAGTARAVPQDESLVTKSRKIRKDDGIVRWSSDAVDVARRVRAFQPWPSAHARLRFSRGPVNLQILEARAEPGAGKPGEVLSAGGEGILVACGTGLLRILRLKPAARRAMDADSFLRGHVVRPGDAFEVNDER